MTPARTDRGSRRYSTEGIDLPGLIKMPVEAHVRILSITALNNAQLQMCLTTGQPAPSEVIAPGDLSLSADVITEEVI
jgi:hypothetical protein